MSVEVHYDLEGPIASPVVMLSNSLGTDLGMWDGQLDALAEHFRVLRYDQRGHGRSPAPPGPYTIAELAGDALDLLERLGLERVSFCGVSIGGMTGQWLAVNAPERIDRLALCCTSAHLPPREMWTERAETVLTEGMSAVVDAALERWFTPEFREQSPDVVGRTRQTLLRTPPEGYAGCCEAIGSHDLRGQLGEIRAPTLVIAGGDDPATPPDHGRQIAEAVDGARFELVERARHLANVERADEVNRLLLDHLLAKAPV
jgi:3-oxoadipate enol-lactonase